MIIKSIKLGKAYKNCKPQTIGDFGDVNYFVGKNGSGKTSLLWALYSGLKNKKVHGIDIPDLETKPPAETDWNCNYIDLFGQNRPLLPGEDSDDFRKKHIPAHLSTNNDLNKINEKRTNMGEGYAISYSPRPKEGGAHGTIDEYTSQSNSGEEFKILPGCITLSSGLRVFSELERVINEILGRKGDNIIIFIEEPENSLHPQMQKDIPGLLGNLCVKAKAEDESIQFFVVTHSPFVVSAGYDMKHKVFTFDGGTCTEASTNRELFLYCLKGLLGFDSSDVGPASICILEENTLLKLLRSLQEIEIVRKDVTFISAGCESKAPEFVKAINAFKTIFKCHPLYKDDYYVITDNIEEVAESTHKALLKINEDEVERYRPLKKTDIEMYYGNLDKTTYGKYTSKSEIENLGEDYEERGIAKEKLTQEVAKNVKNEEDFSKLFEGELNYLLKSEQGKKIT